MKMKRVFSILCTFATVATIAVVSFLFARGLNTGKEIFNEIYAFSNSADRNNLEKIIDDCNILTDEVLGTELVDEMKYFPELEETLDKLIDSENHLSSKLIFDNKKSVITNKISDRYSTLVDIRTSLIHKFSVYKIKMSGNTYGNPESTFDDIVLDLLDYLDYYSQTINLLNDYVYESVNLSNETTHNIISVYTHLVSNLCNNYSNLTFGKNTFLSIQLFNNRFAFDDDSNLIVGSSVGGLYSLDAYKFNGYYKKCNTTNFALNFYAISLPSINVTTEKDSEKLAYFYLDRILKEVL